MKRLLGKRDRAAIWGWDFDGGQKRVRVQRECVGTRHEVSTDVAFEIPRGDIGERGLGDKRVWGRAIVAERATCGLHQLGHDPSRLQGSRPRTTMDALLTPEVQSNLRTASGGCSSGVSGSGCRGRITVGMVGGVFAHCAVNQRFRISGPIGRYSNELHAAMLSIACHL